MILFIYRLNTIKNIFNLNTKTILCLYSDELDSDTALGIWNMHIQSFILVRGHNNAVITIFDVVGWARQLDILVSRFQIAEGYQ